MSGTHERTSIAGEEVAAFVPRPLPPADPPLAVEPARLRAAEQALARLEVAGEMVPSIDWFIYGFVRKEAVLSSQIEGTQATLVDLLAFEATAEEHGPDVEEVCNYLDALVFARKQLASPGGLPLSMRLLGETHRRLMRGVRGAQKQPGEVRRTQNWIGGTRPGNAAFVPPPPQALPGLLGQLERYLHEDDELPALVRAGLVHVQFETLHPYLDGNGRLGRLLVTLLLEHWGLLAQPLLYMSLYFKRHRDEYYRRLDAVRAAGDWEGWTSFFLEGVTVVATEALDTARELSRLVARDRARVLEAAGTSVAAARLFELLPRHPIVTLSSVVKLLATTKPTAGRAIEALAGAGVLVETTGKKRDRAYSYARYVDLLRAGTEL